MQPLVMKPCFFLERFHVFPILFTLLIRRPAVLSISDVHCLMRFALRLSFCNTRPPSPLSLLLRLDAEQFGGLLFQDGLEAIVQLQN